VNRPLVCVSIEGYSVKECIKAAGLATLAGADILEIRFDFLYLSKVYQKNNEDSDEPNNSRYELIPRDVSDIDVPNTINRLKEAIEKPVIFTCRSTAEGGKFPGTEEERLKILTKAIESNVSWVDLEINIDSKERKNLMKLASKSNTKIVSSFHDTEKTPEAEKIISLIEDNVETGDLIKLCFKTNDHHDGIEIVNACWSLRDSKQQMSLMGLGPSGDWTRLHAPLLNQAMVYATLESDFHLGKKGLINVRDLTDAWDMLEY
tara:strand:+ start:410 stop:1195 length:786 start_codon:yes stop_codon:yes gene_type:complete